MNYIISYNIILELLKFDNFFDIVNLITTS